MKSITVIGENKVDNFFKFLADYKDALDFLFGSGIFLAVLGGLFTLGRWIIKEYRVRRIRTNDNFPFRIISPNSNVAKEILGGADDDPLADRNIPYQQRIQGRNTRREFEELIEDNRWILITGRTGLGKTREAVQVAQSLNNEGWTILYLTREAWLDAPAKLPANVSERKILFFLDDLNKKCYSSKAEVRPDTGESLTLPINEPFQTRLARTLEAFDIFCGKNEIRVIATARNEETSEFDEPSEWDKLGWTKHNNLWEKFKFVELPEPDKTAEQKLLAETAGKADILINLDELPTLAKRNDGTFRNLVENLSSSRTEGFALSTENFRDTLKGTWQKRYQKTIQRHPEAKYIYDSIELLQTIGIQLSFSTVFQVAEIISCQKLFQRILSRRKYSSVLKQLIKTENLLRPRDGQIEAKGYKVRIEKYLKQLYFQIGKDHYSTYSIFEQVDYFYSTIFLTPKGFFLEEKISLPESIFSIFVPVHHALNNIGNAYGGFGYNAQATALYKKSIELKKKSIYHVLLPSSSTGLGVNYYELGLDEDAIRAYKDSIEFYKKDYLSWSNLGTLYLYKQNFDDAIRAFNKALEIAPKYSYAILSLAVCLKKIGKDIEGEKHIVSVEPFITKEKEYFQSCYHIAKGDIDKGLLFLKKGLDKHQASKAWARRDPNFAIIQDNPQFKEIVELH